jgi:hypothetical protein
MATISLRTNRGDGDFAVTFANPGTAAGTADIELNINVGLTRKWEPQELEAALRRFQDWLYSNEPLYRGL